MGSVAIGAGSRNLAPIIDGRQSNSGASRGDKPNKGAMIKDEPLARVRHRINLIPNQLVTIVDPHDHSG